MVDSRMKRIEAKIKHALENKGIKCQSVFAMQDPEDTRVLLAFNSQENRKLSIRKIENALETLNVGEFKIPREFQRLSSAFLHLEVSIGARTETPITPGAA
jgi:tRNA nucleotidyltransferase (CCA-adding enzyme)